MRSVSPDMRTVTRREMLWVCGFVTSRGESGPLNSRTNRHFHTQTFYWPCQNAVPPTNGHCPGHNASLSVYLSHIAQLRAFWEMLGENWLFSTTNRANTTGISRQFALQCQIAVNYRKYLLYITDKCACQMKWQIHNIPLNVYLFLRFIQLIPQNHKG